MRDVAAVANVDPSVVSRVLSGDEQLSIRPETRQRVLDAVTRLGYRPNFAAQMLKTSRAMAIGMVVPDFANTAYAEIARGAEQRAAGLDYILLLASGASQDRLPMLEGRVDGLLFAAATSEPDVPIRLPEGVPRVLVNRREPGLGPSVIGNDEACAATATQHLIDLGHKRIACIVAASAVDTGRRRIAGFTKAMNEARLPLEPEPSIQAPLDESGGFEVTRELLRRDPRPTAIVVATPRWALGALAACHEAGLSVPGDVSVVAFSDLPIAQYMRPALTTVQLPLFEMGSRGVDMLLSLVEGGAVSDVMIDAPVELTVRASTGPPPGG